MRGSTALICAAAGLLLALRCPDRLAHGFLWAEDALVFLKGAIEGGGASLVELWAGYVVLIPRLLALVLAWTTSIEHAPYVYVWATWIVSAVCAGVTYGSLRRTLCAQRPAIAAAMSLLPYAVPHSGEVYLTLTNIQWVAAPALLALCLEVFFWGGAPPRLIPAILALGLTGPFVLLFAPVAALGVLVTRRVDASGLAWALASAVQVFAVASSNVPGPSWVQTHWAELFWSDFLLGAFLPALSPHPLSRLGWAAAVALGVTIVTVVLRSRDRLAAGSFLVVAVVLWTVAVMRVHTPGLCLRHLSDGARYLIVPTTMVGWALLLAGGWRRPQWVGAIAAALLALLIVPVIRSPRVAIYERWRIVETSRGVYDVHVAPAGFSTSITMAARRLAK